MSKSKAPSLKEIFDEHSVENKISIFNQILNTIIRSIYDDSLVLLDTELATQQINYFLNIISDIDRASPEVIEIIEYHQEQLMLALDLEENDQQIFHINMLLDFLDPPSQEPDISLSPSLNITEHKEDIGSMMRSAAFNSNVRFYAENKIMSCSYKSYDGFMGALKMHKEGDDDSTI